MIGIILFSFWTGLATPTLTQGVNSKDAGTEPVGVALLRREAKVLEPLVESRLAHDFLTATADLPAIAPRTIYLDEARRTYFTETEAHALSPESRRTLARVPVDEPFYYTAKYGSPLAYVRPLDLLGRSGLESVAGRKVLDFGYGTIGQLHLLAALGADVTGVDVDPLLRALYSAPGDQGLVKGRRGRDGRIRLIDGRFPFDEAVRTAVGGEYDLIVSKNTLKRGYVHPERPVDQRRLLNLGVDDVDFLKALHSVLKPGGRLLIYNISPAPSPPEKPYKNWADGRCPFPVELWKSSGFRILAFDREDSGPIRAIAQALGWDRGESPMDLKNDLFAMYSLFQKLGAD
jgi:SAM-dependent methyltransferase